MARKRNKQPKFEASEVKQGSDVYDADTAPDWDGCCDVCGMSPILPATGLCGPCTFSESDTAGGNW